MWVGADVKCPTRPKQLISAKKIMFWVCFALIGIADIVMLPPGETFDRSFFVDIILDSLKKKFTQIPKITIRIQKSATFWICIMPDSIWPIRKFKQIISPGCPIHLTTQIWPGPTSGFLDI
jgi:hypothetical protein